MKNILFIILIFTVSNLYAKDYDLIFNFSGSYKKNEIIFLDNSRLSHNVYFTVYLVCMFLCI